MHADSNAFSNVEHKHKNPVASLDYARVLNSIIYVKIRERTAPINIDVVQRQSTQNTASCALSKKTDATLAPAKTLLILSSFAKGSVPAYLQFLYL